MIGAEAAVYVKWVQDHADDQKIKDWLMANPGKMYIDAYYHFKQNRLKNNDS